MSTWDKYYLGLAIILFSMALSIWGIFRISENFLLLTALLATLLGLWQYPFKCPNCKKTINIKESKFSGKPFRMSKSGLTYTAFPPKKCWNCDYNLTQSPKSKNMPKENDAINKKLSLAEEFLDDEDFHSAFKIYKSLSDQGLNICDTTLGWMYSHGKGVGTNLEIAKQYLLRPAEEGDKEAQFYLGRNFIQINDLDQAIFWLEKSANSGYSPALFRLGCLYDKDKHLKKDDEKATDYFERAARLNHVGGLIRYSYKLIKGNRGILKIPKGFIILLKGIFLVFYFSSKDEGDERLQT